MNTAPASSAPRRRTAANAPSTLQRRKYAATQMPDLSRMPLSRADASLMRQPRAQLYPPLEGEGRQAVEAKRDGAPRWGDIAANHAHPTPTLRELRSPRVDPPPPGEG